MLKPIPSRLDLLDLFPPALDPRVYRYFEGAQEHPFRPAASDLDAVNASWLADASLLAYAGPPFARQTFAGAGFQLLGEQPLTGLSTQCYVAHSKAVVIVVFRGTQVMVPGRDSLTVLGDQAEDFLADARIALVAADAPSQGRAHFGFRRALREIWEHLVERLAPLRKERPGRPIWLAGHSLGGALAMLAAARLPGSQAVYTFGAPLLADEEFAAAYKVPTFRFVHGEDVIATVPVAGTYLPPRLRRAGFLPALDFIGLYRSIGQRVQISRDGKVTPGGGPEDLPGDLRTKLQQLLRHPLDWAALQPFDDVVDHSPLFYAVHLWNAVERLPVSAVA